MPTHHDDTREYRTAGAPTVDLSAFPTVPKFLDLGSCRNADPAVFFPGNGQPGTEAKAICADCPVRAQCLEWALRIEASAPSYAAGVYGGMSAAERRRVNEALRQEAS